jgi:hypothetical protein
VPASEPPIPVLTARAAVPDRIHDAQHLSREQIVQPLYGLGEEVEGNGIERQVPSHKQAQLRSDQDRSRRRPCTDARGYRRIHPGS